MSTMQFLIPYHFPASCHDIAVLLSNFFSARFSNTDDCEQYFSTDDLDTTMYTSREGKSTYRHRTPGHKLITITDRYPSYPYPQCPRHLQTPRKKQHPKQPLRPSSLFPSNSVSRFSSTQSTPTSPPEQLDALSKLRAFVIPPRTGQPN